MADYFVDFYIKLQLSYSMPVTEGIFILCVIVLMSRFEHRPRYYLRTAAHFILSWAAVILFKGSIYGTAFGHFAMTYALAFYLVVYAAIGGNLPFAQRMFCCLCFLAVQVFSTSFAKACGAIVCTLAGGNYDERMASLSLVVVRTLLFVGFTVLMKLFPLRKFGRGPAPVYYVFASLTVVFAYIAKLIVDNIKDFTNAILNPTETEYAPFVFFVGLLLYFLTALAYCSCYYGTEKRLKNAVLRQQIGTIREHYEADADLRELSRDNLDEMRRIRHDIKNQFTYMQLILEQNKYDELRRYFRELNEKVALPLSYSDCENRIVRDVLNLEINKLRGNVNIDYKLAIESRLAIDDLDLTTLLINLLDNAVEACERDKADGAVITFNMREKDGYLYVTVENPVADTARARAAFGAGTAKGDSSAHGYGTGIIAAVAEKHKGVVKYTIENGTFRADVMLALDGDRGGRERETERSRM